LEKYRKAIFHYPRKDEVIMVKVTTFEIVDHGIDNPSYFQGCGTSFTSFSDCFTGIGEDYKEALDDCLEQIAAAGIDDVSMIEPELDAEHNGESVSEYLESQGIKIDDGEGPDLYYYVSIRFNTAEAYPDCYLYIVEEKTGQTWIAEIKGKTKLDLKKRIKAWIKSEYGGEIVLDGDIVSNGSGICDYTGTIFTDHNPPDPVVCWDSCGFFLKST
jgi:hypothetical protein